MDIFISKFNTTSEYNAQKDSLLKPHVSLIKEEGTVVYDKEYSVTLVLNVTQTASGTPICNGMQAVSKVFIDGVESNVISDGYYGSYRFATTGEHTVKVILKTSAIAEDMFDSQNIIYEGGSIMNPAIPMVSVTMLNVTSIEGAAFYDCNTLTAITIPNTVTYIGDYAFEFCTGLSAITIPDSVTLIDTEAFDECTSLTSVTIGSGVTSINNNAFYSCSSLNSITCYATIAPTISNGTFANIKTGGTLYVPSGSDYSTWMQNANYYLGKYNWSIDTCDGPVTPWAD